MKALTVAIGIGEGVGRFAVEAGLVKCGGGAVRLAAGEVLLWTKSGGALMLDKV